MLARCQRWLSSAWRHPFRTAVVLLLLGLAAFFGTQHLGAYSHYRAARHCLAQHDFNGALTHIDACLAVWPRSAAAQLLAARAARRANQFDRAVEHLEACQRLGGPAEQVVLERYLLRAQQGDLAGVEKRLLALVHREHPDTLLILDVLTERWMLAHRLGEARSYLDLWLQLQPNSRAATIRRAWVSERLSQTSEAIQGYSQALSLDPDLDRRENDRVRLRLAELLLQSGRPGEALEHFEVLHERQPQNAAVTVGLSRCLHSRGQTGQAMRLLDGLIAENPRAGKALAERGRLALEQGRLAEAEAWLRRALALRPFDRQAVYNLSVCLQKAGKRDEARKYDERLARIEADARRVGRLMKEVLRSPDNADLRYQIGVIFLRNRMNEEGLRWLLSALAQDPAHAPSHKALAEHYEGAGQREHALVHRRALQHLSVRTEQPAQEQQ